MKISSGPSTLIGNPTGVGGQVVDVPLGTGLSFVNGALVSTGGSPGPQGPQGPPGPQGPAGSGLTSLALDEPGLPVSTGFSDFYYNHITINGDQITTTNPPGGGTPGTTSSNNIYTYGLGITMNGGGADCGSKAGFIVRYIHDTPSNPAQYPGANVTGYKGATGDRVAATFAMVAHAGDGGTDTTDAGCNGTVSACNPFVSLGPDAKNLFWVGGAEVDIQMELGSSARHRMGWVVTSGGGNPNPCPGLDCAYAVSGGGAPWTYGLAFETLHGVSAFSPSSTTLIGCWGNVNAFVGINLRDGASISWPFVSNGFWVNRIGDINCHSVAQTSDISIKRDITDTKYGLADILKIKVHDATFTTDGLNRPTLIAQELAKVIPEAVVTQEDGKLAINYSGVLVPILIKAIQELANR